MTVSLDTRLAQALQTAPPGSPLGALVEGDAWPAPLAPVLLRWVRGEASRSARATLPLRARELSEWCAALLAECESLISAPASPFDLLESDPATATPASVREQFRRLALASHPDRRPAGERARWEARQVELNLAYERLKTDDDLAAERRAIEARRPVVRHFALAEMEHAHVADLAARARRWLDSPIPPAALPSLAEERARPRRRLVFAASFIVTAVAVAIIAWISQQPAGIARPLSFAGMPPPHHGAGGASAPVVGAATPAGPDAAGTTDPAADPSATSETALAPGIDPFELGPSASLDFKPVGVSRPTPSPASPAVGGDPAAQESIAPAVEAPPPAAPAPARTDDHATSAALALPPAGDPADLDRFLAAYDLAYRQGDLPRLRELFANDVVQNGADTFDTIMERYARFFAQAERVEMTSARLRHRLDDAAGGVELVAVYALRFEVRAAPRPGQRARKPDRRTMEGDFTMLLRPDPAATAGYRIARLDF